MAIVGELLVLIGANNTALTAGLAKSEAELKGFGATAATHSGLIGSAAHAAGIAVLGVGAVAAVSLGFAAKAAGDFQEQMAIINTIAHQTPAELTKTGDSIRAMAASTGTPLSDMTKGFYDLLSAGVPVSQAMSVLKSSTTLAIGGLATTSQTVDLLTTAINSYHLNAKGATIATDQFALAVQDGKVTADQIAATFADVAPLAKQAGVGIDEIGATYAVLTARGVPAAEATTQMNRAMIELLKPNADLNALQEKTHLNFAKIASEKGLVVALQEMRTAAAANHVPFQDLFGRLEGLKFALGTTGPNFGAYADELDKMHHANGTAAAQAEERMGTFHRQTAILGETFNNLLITVGTPLLPFLTSLVSNISAGVQVVSEWIAQFPSLGAALASIPPHLIAVGTEIVGRIPGALVELAGQISGWIVAQAPAWLAQLETWADAFVAWISPLIGQALEALGDLAAQISSWIVAQIPAFVAQIGQWANAFIGWVGPMIPGALASLGEFAGRIVDWIAAQLPTWFAAFLRWVDAFVAWVGPMIPKVLAALAVLGAQIVGWIVGRIPAVATALVQLAGQFVAWVAPKIPGLIAELGKLAIAMGGWIAQQIPVIAAEVGKWIVSFIGWIAQSIPQAAVELGKWLVGVLAWMATVPGKLLTAAVEWGKAIFRGIVTGIGDIAKAISDAIAGGTEGHNISGIASGLRGQDSPLHQFASGGIVPGTGPMLAIVHGGESITPAGGGGTTHVHLHNLIELDGRTLIDFVEEHLFNNASGYSSGFQGAPGVTGA